MPIVSGLRTKLPRAFKGDQMSRKTRQLPKGRQLSFAQRHRSPRERKNAPRRDQRHENALKALTENVPQFDLKLERAHLFLEKNHQVQRSQFQNATALWQELPGREESKLIRISRERYFSALAYIYGLFVAVIGADNKDEL